MIEHLPAVHRAAAHWRLLARIPFRAVEGPSNTRPSNTRNLAHVASVQALTSAKESAGSRRNPQRRESRVAALEVGHGFPSESRRHVACPGIRSESIVDSCRATTLSRKCAMTKRRAP
jgi:hypothetical protein